jgi:hypothetical protein
MSWSAQSLAPVGSCIGGLLATFTGIPFNRCPRRSWPGAARGVVMQISGHEQQSPGMPGQVHICALAPGDRSAIRFGQYGASGERLRLVALQHEGPWSGLGRLHLPRAAGPPMHQPRATTRPRAQQNQPSVLRCNWHTCCLQSSTSASHVTHGHSTRGATHVSHG